MFKFSLKKKILRLSALGAVVAVAVALTGTFVAQQSDQDTNAATAAGQEVHLQYAAAEPIYYSGVWTMPFNITSNGTTYRGYCTDPSKYSPVDNSYYEAEYATVAGEGFDFIRMLLYINEQAGNPLARAAWQDIFIDANHVGGSKYVNGLPDNVAELTADQRFAWTHVIISSIINGDTYGITATEGEFIISAEAVLREYRNTNAPIWKNAESYRLYKLVPGVQEGSERQSVVWIEPTYSTVKAKKCDAEAEGGACAVAGRDRSNIRFTLYNYNGFPMYQQAYDEYVEASYDTTKTVAENAAARYSSITGLTNSDGEVIFNNITPGTYIVAEEETNSTYLLTATPQGVIVGSESQYELIFNNMPVEVPEYSVTTTAIDESDGDHSIASGSAAVIADNVSFCGVANTNYKLRGIIGKKNGNTMNEIKVISSSDPAIKTGNNKCGSFIMRFNLTASDLEGLANGDQLVVYEYLYDADGDYSTPLASHAVINDANQTINIFEYNISTTAKDNADNDDYVLANQNATIKDDFTICGEKGKTYSVKGSMHKNDGTLVGNEKTINNLTIPADDADGCINSTMVFDGFDATSLAGQDIYVSQQLISGTTVVATHDGNGEEAQTIHIVKVGTTAVDNADGDKFISAAANQAIKDTIAYENLIPGETYTVTGTLHYGNQTATKSMQITPTTKNGTCEMVFDPINATALAGKKTYVAETISFNNNIVAEHDDENDANQTVYIVGLATTAVDNADNDKYIEIGKAATIKDTVTFSGKANTAYSFKGTIKVKGTTNILKTVTGAGTTNANGIGTMSMNFSLTAAQLSDVIAGHELIVYEYMYESDDTDLSTPIAKHENDNDTNQTIYVLSLGTVAVDGSNIGTNGDKYLDANRTATIADTVNYCGKPGATYIIKGVLMNKKTGTKLLSVSGDPITSQSNKITIPANANPACGTAIINFTFDARGLGGTDIVVYETMYEINGEDENKAITHEDINDNSQTITIINMGTFAEDATGGELADGDRFIEAGKEVTIKDTVKYCLKAEDSHSYTVNGRLMNADTGEPLIAEGETSKTVVIKPTAEKYCGNVVIEFTFDASELAGTNIVVFENIRDEEGTIILTHEDPTDINQTIEIISLETNAVDKETSKKQLPVNQIVTIKDTVSYCLKGGREYTLKGTLMNKKTGEPLMIDEKVIESEVAFTPKAIENPDDPEAEVKYCGSVEMEFTLNTANLGGAELVVFETLYYDNETVLEHHDINDEDQTVIVELPTPDTGLFTQASKGSTEENGTPIVIAVLSVILVGGYALIRFTAKKRFLRR